MGCLVPGRPQQTPYDRFLDEVAASGYEWIELGPFGYLPTDPEKLSAELAARDLKLSAGTVFERLHQDNSWDAVWSQIEDVAKLTAAVGGKHVVVIPEMWRDPSTGAVLEDRNLTTEQWQKKTNGMNELGKAMFEKYGVRASTTRTPTAMSTPRRTSTGSSTALTVSSSTSAWTPDTSAIAAVTTSRSSSGHRSGSATYTSGRSTRRSRRKCHGRGSAVGEAVKLGAMTEPPRGIPEMAPLLSAVERLGIDVFAIVEQDLYPCEVDAPLPIAKRTRQYSARVVSRPRNSFSGPQE